MEVLKRSPTLLQVTICHRYMDYKRDASYPAYVKVLDDTIQQYILCDTKTLGGGWIVIQVVVKGYGMHTLLNKKLI